LWKGQLTALTAFPVLVLVRHLDLGDNQENKIDKKTSEFSFLSCGGF